MFPKCCRIVKLGNSVERSKNSCHINDETFTQLSKILAIKNSLETFLSILSSLISSRKVGVVDGSSHPVPPMPSFQKVGRQKGTTNTPHDSDRLIKVDCHLVLINFDATKHESMAIRK